RDIIPDELPKDAGWLQTGVHWYFYTVESIPSAIVHFGDKVVRTKTPAEYAAPAWYEYGEYCADKIFSSAESFANLLASSKDLFPAMQVAFEEMKKQGLKQTVLNGIQHTTEFAAWCSNELAVFTKPLTRNGYELAKWTYNGCKDSSWQYGEKVYEITDGWISPKLAIALSAAAMSGLACLYLKYKLRRIPAPLVVNNNQQIIQPQPAPLLLSAQVSQAQALPLPGQPDPSQIQAQPQQVPQPAAVPAPQP
ncbi:MAG TPA: hypothetical protein VFP93_02075, partial [Gammaproteobacteria bacterium]|nr:hypothetical protein [Gammaproteobacteria bacterium]